MMQVHLVNDGPVTIPLDSRKFTYVSVAEKPAAGGKSSNNKQQQSQPAAAQPATPLEETSSPTQQQQVNGQAVTVNQPQEPSK
jgi:hypothetical protein